VMEFGKSANSALTVPVYSPPTDGYEWCKDHPGYSCTKAWQWNLERITDPNGYKVYFNYSQEQNYFLAGQSSVRTIYERAAHVDYIRYGDGPGKNHHAQVDFEIVYRCDPGHAECDTWEERAGSMSFEQKLDGTLFPDVPVDLYCPEGSSCLQQSPNFFTHKALGAITTQYKQGSSWVDVDRWLLSQSFPPPGDGEPKLWLEAIQKQDVSGSNHLNPVEFDYVMLPSRADTGGGVVSAQKMPRINGLLNELNGEVSIVYGKSADCTDTDMDDDPNNDVYWPGGTHAPRRLCDSSP